MKSSEYASDSLYYESKALSSHIIIFQQIRNENGSAVFYEFFTI